MEFEKIVIKELKPISLDQIDISEDNVRKTRQRSGLEALKTSISTIDLIHPIIVEEKENHRYELVAGQRRYLAFVELQRNEIPAIVIGEINSPTKKLVSLSENIHRKNLPYNDTIEVCQYLFNKYKGPKYDRIEKIANDLGISPETVKKYLSYLLVPDEVRKMVEDGKINPKVAYDITQAFWPNKDKIIRIAELTKKMTRPEWERVLDVGKEKPNAPIEEILEDAKKPSKNVEIEIVFSQDTIEQLEKIRKERNASNIPELIKILIQEIIEQEVI